MPGSSPSSSLLSTTLLVWGNGLVHVLFWISLASPRGIVVGHAAAGIRNSVHSLAGRSRENCPTSTIRPPSHQGCSQLMAIAATVVSLLTAYIGLEFFWGRFEELLDIICGESEPGSCSLWSFPCPGFLMGKKKIVQRSYPGRRNGRSRTTLPELEYRGRRWKSGHIS